MKLALGFFILAVSLALVSARRTPKVIIDIDPGVDDAEALIMLLSQSQKHTVLAITVSQGNTFLSNATHNTLRILRLCGRLDIPVFLGNEYTLDGHVKNTSIYFGLNGFGNVPDDTYDYSKYLRQPENAWQALVRLVHTFPNEITLISLGTQTNIANAMKTSRRFGRLLKRNIVMGGNYRGIGNESPHAEFNFLIDPHAANLVIKFLRTEIIIITWELCLDSATTWEWYDSYINLNTTKAKFLKMISNFSRKRAIREKSKTYLWADQIAMAAYLDTSIILSSQKIEARVETKNPKNYGEMVVNWNSRRKYKNIKLVTRINVEKVKRLVEKSVK